MLFLLLLTTSAWPCLKHSHNRGPTSYPSPVVRLPAFFAVNVKGGKKGVELNIICGWAQSDRNFSVVENHSFVENSCARGGLAASLWRAGGVRALPTPPAAARARLLTLMLT